MGGVAYMDDDFKCTIGSNADKSGNGAWMFDPDYSSYWRSYVVTESSIVKTGNILNITASSSHNSGRADASGYLCIHSSTIKLEIEYNESERSTTNKFGKIIYLSYEGTNDYSQSKSAYDRKPLETISLAAKDIPVKSRLYGCTDWKVSFKDDAKPDYWSFDTSGKDSHFYRKNDNNYITLSIEFK